ncbi:MAG: 50S ribosomal protein L6 [Candidatus Nanohalarchaeota archaeon]|nr:MAG: 50S ribosomal protein L6 [Candidatus Nanohaloarchaeota archaeon]
MIEKKIELADEVEASFDSNVLTIKGKLGEIKREFSYPLINLEVKDKTIIVSSSKDRKKQKAIVGAWTARANNMIRGVNKPFVYKLKLVFSHFPMKVKIENNRIIVSNYLGGKGVREVKIKEDVEVKMLKEGSSEYLTVESTNKEHAGLYAAKIERLCVAKNKDRRVFQDGIYLIEKPGKGNKSD